MDELVEYEYDEIVEVTDGELAHFANAVGIMERHKLADRAADWIYRNSDLATDSKLCFMNDADPSELLDILYGRKR